MANCITTPPTLPSTPVSKKRRLNGTTPSSPQASLLALKASPVASPDISISNTIRTVSIAVCATCHRAAANTIQCSICKSTACTVCSRRCTHSTSSQPLTPHLTFSPSLSPSSLGEPQRRLRSVLSSVLAPNSNLPAHVESTPMQGKRRRKHVDDEGQYSISQSTIDASAKDRLLLSSDEMQMVDEKHANHEDLGVGCDRLVCRNCCYENVMSNTTTCNDCYLPHV